MAKIIAFMVSIITFLCNFLGVNMSVKVTNTTEQTINGWGTSACWWAQMVDDESTRATLAKELFSEEGLGLNIYRYNIGGGTNPETNRISNKSRQTESFYYYNEEDGKWEFDFTRDANAQKMLFAALDEGCVDTVVLFANSPHYTMTKNNQTAGSVSGGSTNMDPAKYQDYVDYFLTITEYFISKGVPVKYISPINEPEWDWGGDWVSQEGCHYEKEDVLALAKLFAQGIEERNLDVKLMLPESGEITDLTKEYFTELQSDEVIARNVGSYAYHSYWKDSDAQTKINLGTWRQETFPYATMDMTEWCELPCKHDVDDLEAATLMARVISNDVSLSYANSWSNWVALNSTAYTDGNKYSDGLFWADGDNYNKVEKTMRWYAFAHFSKFVPAGSVVLKTSFNYMNIIENDGKFIYEVDASAFRTPDNETVLVLVNEGDEKTINLPTLGKNAEVYVTDSTHKLEKTYEGKKLSKVTMEKNSIATVVYSSSSIFGC